MAKRTAKRTAKKKGKKKARRAGSAGAASRSRRISPAKGKARSKSDVCATIAEEVGLNKKQVAEVFDVMGDMIAADLKKGAAGAFNIPGMMKITVQRKPATKARKGINPFTGEPTVFKAKPARNVVKIRPLKALKEKV